MKAIVLLTISLALAACGADRATEPGAQEDAAPDLSRLRPGLFTYLADAPAFRACDGERPVPVAMEDAYIDLERAYLAADKPAPGAPLLVLLEGRIAERPAMEGDALVPTLVVERFVGLFPDLGCEDAMTDAELTDTRWRIVSLGGLRIELPEGGREAELVLESAGARYAAGAGCNRIIGEFEAGDGDIAFAPGATTRMACPPPLDDYERELISVLANARRWRITGRVLELFGSDGQALAVLESG